MSRVGSDVDAVQDVVIRGTDSVLANPAALGGRVGHLLRPETPFSGSRRCFPSRLSAFCSASSTGRCAACIAERARSLGLVNAKVQDDLSGIRVIKGFAREADEAKGFRAGRAAVPGRESGGDSPANGLLSLYTLDCVVWQRRDDRFRGVPDLAGTVHARQTGRVSLVRALFSLVPSTI